MSEVEEEDGGAFTLWTPFLKKRGTNVYYLRIHSVVIYRS